MPATGAMHGVFEQTSPGGKRQLEAGEAERNFLLRAGDIAARQQQLAEGQWDLSRGMWTQSAPLRAQGVADLAAFQRTGALPPSLDVGLDAMYRTGREDLEAQYKNARRQTIEGSGGVGGQLASTLGDLSGARAREVGRLQSDILGQFELPMRQALFSRGLDTGFQGAQMGMQGMLGSTGQVGQAGGLTGQLGQAFGQTAGREQQALLQREEAKKGEAQQIGQMVGMAGI